MHCDPIFEISKFMMFQRNELSTREVDDYFEPNRPAYLYMILSKNRISINHEYVSFTKTHINTEFLINNRGKIIKEQLHWKHNYKDLEELKIVSDFPYNNFSVIDEAGSTLIGGKAAYFPENKAFYQQIKNKDFLDYEIVYIGQSVTENGNAPVLSRTLAHETYQKILEEYSSSHIDKELFTFFFSFKQKLLIDFPEQITDQERKIFSKNLSANYFNPTTKEIKQNVTLFEATLINYFKPKYNSNFVNNPPGKEHTSFGTLHEMNFRKVRILFGLADFSPKLYTDTVSRKNEYEIEIEIK